MIVVLLKKYLKFLFILLIMVSCRKEGCTDPLATNYNDKANHENGSCEYDTIKNYELAVKTYHIFNSSTFHLDSIYFDDFGNKIKFSRAVFYLGNPLFKNTNVYMNNRTNDYILISPSDSIFPFTSLNNLDLNSVELRIGVDSITNHTDPGKKQNSNPLSYQSPSMHWQMGIDSTDWSYLFIVIEGQVDIDGNNNFDSGESFVFHIGGDGFSRLTNNISLNISEDSSSFSLDINWDSIINDIDLSTNNFTHTMDNIPLATEIANNSINLISEHI